MKHFIILITTVALILSKVSAAVEVGFPPELADATTVFISATGEEKDAVYLKTKGKWIDDNAIVKALTGNVSWVVFDWNGKRMRQVLQVIGGSVLLFSETLTLRYSIRIPLREFFRAVLPQLKQLEKHTPSNQANQAEQDGGGQPATRPESK